MFKFATMAALAIGIAAPAFAGPGEMSATASGQALWQFPDRKALDPALFGTPDAP